MTRRALLAALVIAVPWFVDSARAGEPRVADGASPIHFRPRQGNFADPIPFFWKGEYHVFYLRGDVPKVPWEHIASKDLISWRELPTALISDGADDGPDGLHMFTGSVIEQDGVFHLYYTGWNPANREGREFVMHATSPDLVKWTKHPADKFAPDGRVYAKKQDSDFRDPFVFWNETEKRWWMLLCTRAASDNRPVTGVYTSTDLVHWEPQAPLCDGTQGTPECPDLFRLGDLWYLITSPSDNVTRYRTAKDLRGPWSPAPGLALDAPIFYAAKSQFDGRRHVLTGWLRDRENGKDDGGFRWGGTQSLPRELFAGPGGALLSRPVPEARTAYPRTFLDLAAKPKFTTLDSEGRAAGKPDPWRYEGGHLVAESEGLTRTRLDVPADYHLSLTMRLTGPAATFALAIRQQPERDSHYRLEVRPSKNEATLASFGSDYARSVPFEAGRDVQIEAFVQGPLIECFINGGHAFSGRAYQFREGKLDLLLTGGKVEIRNLVITVPEGAPQAALRDNAEARAALSEAVAMTKGKKPYESWVSMMLALGEAQGRCGDREAARETLGIVADAVAKLNNGDANRFFLGDLARAQADAGLAEDARNSVERFRKAPKVENKAVGTDKTSMMGWYLTTSPVGALLKIGDYPAARELVREYALENAGGTDKEKEALKTWLRSSLERIDDAETSAFFFKGDPEAKKRAVATAEERAKAAVDARAADRIFSRLSSMQAEAGDFSGAKDSAHRLSVDGKTSLSVAASLLSIATVQLESGDRAGAAETARASLKLHRAAKSPGPLRSEVGSFSPAGLTAQTLGVIAQAESPDAALKLKDELEDVPSQVVACLAIAKVLVDRKDLDRARELAKQAETLARNIEDSKIQTQAVDEVLTSRIRLGLDDDPTAPLKGMSPGGLNAAESAVIMELARRGECAEAAEFAATLENSFLKDFGVQLVAMYAITGGHADKVLAAARSAKTDKERCEWLRGMATGLSNRGNKTRPIW